MKSRQRLGVTRLLWLVVAVIVIVLVVGVAVQRIYSAPSQTTTSSYQALVNQIQSQGYSQEEAQYIAASNVTVISSNQTYSDVMVIFPNASSTEVITTAQPVQNFTINPNALNYPSDGIYNATFSNVNDTSSQSIVSNLTYYVQNSTLYSSSTTSSAAAAILLPLSLSAATLSVIRAAGAAKNAVRQEDLGNILGIYDLVKSIVKTGQQAWKNIQKATDINDQYTKWLDQINSLEDCAKNPTNPATINGYQQDPTQEQKIIDQIESAKSQLTEMTVIRFVNVALSEGINLVKISLIEGKALFKIFAEHSIDYSESTLKDLSQELVNQIQRLVTPCTTSSTSTSTTTSTTTTTTISSTSSPLHEDYYGSFQWTLNAGSGYVESTSGSFSFSIDPSTYAITGSGTGFVTDKLGSPSPCSASGSGGYSFAVSGMYATYDNNLSLQFGNANPQTVTAQETCPGPPTVVETATWVTGAGVLPSYAMITAVDGATVSCPPTCLGSEVTYQITIHSGQQTSTESTTQTTTTTETSSTSTSLSTSSETTSSTSTSSSSYTSRLSSTSNSTSTAH